MLLIGYQFDCAEKEIRLGRKLILSKFGFYCPCFSQQILFYESPYFVDI